MMKPNFAVVTFVTATLVAVGVFVKFAGPSVPNPPTNRLAQSSEDFLLQATYQPVDWLPLTQDSFSEARRTGKPILMAIGAAFSQAALDIDKDVFSDNSFAVYLQRNFVCVRVDGLEHPEWLNSIAPLSRAQNPFLVGLQLCVLDPAARPIAFLGRTGREQNFDKDYVTLGILTAKAKYDSAISLVGTPGPLNLVQTADIAALRNPQRGSMPSFPMFGASLSGHIDPIHGGFPMGYLQVITPNAWRYLLSVGRTRELARSLQPILLSPMVDWVDGGFFHVMTNADAPAVEYGKVTTDNAEMLQFLTSFSLLTDEPRYRYLALKTFDYLANMRLSTGLLPACQVPDLQPNGRSLRYSFSSNRLHQILTDSERNWARDNLGLDVSQNQTMVPHLSKWDSASDPNLDAVINKLSRAYRPPAKFTNPNLVNVNGFTVARMLESARLLSDPDRMLKAQALAEVLQTALYGGELVRRTIPAAPDASLATYLGYADTCLADFLTSGRVVSLDRGIKVLTDAFDRFGRTCPGYLTMSPLGEQLIGMEDTDVPEVLDNLNEASMAGAIRLAHNYGRLLSDTPTGKNLIRRAYLASSLVTGLGLPPVPRMAGFYLAAAQLTDDGYAITVGPHAQEDADTLAKRWPTRLVAPAFGPVRRDLQARAPGVYVIRGSEVRGPFTVEQAANQLSSTLLVEG